MTDVVGLMETRRGYFRAFFEHHRELPDKQRARIIRERDAYEQFVIDLIDRGQGEGVLRPVSTQLATFGLFGMVSCYQCRHHHRLCITTS